MPPCREMAMARRPSVTVSIAADTIGMFSEIVRVRHVRVSACAGSTDDFPGKSSTSSNVSPSGMAPSIIFAPMFANQAVNNKAQQGSLGCSEIHLSRKTFISEFTILGLTRAEIKALNSRSRLDGQSAFKQS